MDADDIGKEIRTQKAFGTHKPRCNTCGDYLVNTPEYDDGDFPTHGTRCGGCFTKYLLSLDGAEETPRTVKMDCRYCLISAVLPGSLWCAACRNRIHRKILSPIADKVQKKEQLTDDEKGIINIARMWPIWEKEFKGLEGKI